MIYTVLNFFRSFACKTYLYGSAPIIVTNAVYRTVQSLAGSFSLVEEPAARYGVLTD